MKKNKKDLLFTILLLTINLFTWYHILFQQIQGEGFAYFQTNMVSLPDKLSQKHDVGELSARLLFRHLPNIFGDKMYLYMSLLLSVMLLTYLLLYLSLKAITNNLRISFLSSLLFSTNYAANYNMFSQGGYQYFVQRSIILPIELVSLLLLALYFRTTKIYLYLASFFIFLIAIYLGFFGTMLLPLFIFYPLTASLSKKNIKNIWTPIPFILGNLLLVQNHPTFCTSSSCNQTNKYIVFIDFISNAPKTISSITQQASVITTRFLWTNWFKTETKLWFGLTSPEKYLLSVQIFTVLLYFFALIIIQKLKPQFTKLAISLLISFALMLILSDYISVESTRTFSTSRYFYFPSVPAAMFWGILFHSLLSHSRKIISCPTKLFLIIIIISNIYWIKSAEKENLWRHHANKDIIAMVKEHSPALKEKPYHVYVSALSTLSPYGVSFTQRFYAHPDSHFHTQDPEIQKLISSNIQPDEIYFFKYDYRHRVAVDKTEEIRQQLRDAYQENN